MTAGMRLPRALFGFLLLAAGRTALALTISPPQLVGTVSEPSLSETSDIVGSRALPGILWVHNDSGDSARFYAIDTTGEYQGRFLLENAAASDWEDMAIGPKPGGGNYLYFGDIGDNNANKSQIAVYRTIEPQAIEADGLISQGSYSKALLQYPGGPRNAESLLVDPLTGDLFIITKSPSGQIYSAPSTIFNTAAVTQLTSVGTLAVAINQPSSADISPDGLHILVRDRSTTAWLFERAANQTVGQALLGAGIPVTLASEVQGEAIGWAADGSGFYTTSEWDGHGEQPLYFYAFNVPEPGSWLMASMGFVLVGLCSPTAAKRRK